jgi:replicative DNA helicase
VDENRSLPQSLEAERIVLGGLMLDADRMAAVMELLDADDFYRESHAHLFALMAEMNQKGEPTEMMAVVQRVASAGRAEEMGGLSYVSSLPDNVASTENLEYYAKVVREHAVTRRLILAARGIADRAGSGQDELEGLLDFAESEVFAVTQQKSSVDWSVLSELVDQEFLRIQNLASRGEDITGVPTGFVDLDRMLAGLQRTDLLILAARPSMGKTALALNICQNCAHQGFGVGVFSLEMGRGQLATRMLTCEARVDASRVRTGRLSEEYDWPKLVEAADALHHLPVYIDDTPGLTVSQIRSKARRLKARYPQLAVLMIDYIGLMSGDPRVSREQQVSAASRGLKALAKEIDVAVIALSQLNRGVEGRQDKRPMLSDLRESGAIEQDADVIMFIYRDEYYNKESPDKNVAEVIVAKQRNGPTGTVRLAFQGEHTRFDNLARESGPGGYL